MYKINKLRGEKLGGVCTIISTKNKKIYQSWHKITKNHV
jgi:hypothetical protein